jgi:hypothetical protein
VSATTNKLYQTVAQDRGLLPRLHLGRKVAWFALLAVTLFACNVSFRLLEASRNYYVFNTDERQATFSDLLLYSAYLYEPPSYSACINKLRQIDGAKQQWALEHHAPENAVPTWNDLRPYLGRGTDRFVLPRCPQGGVYTIGAISNAPTCSVKGHVLE